MAHRYPQRTKSHQLEETSRRFLKNCLPEHWTGDVPSPDYGVDFKIDIFDGTDATGLELLVQLKASENGDDREYETINLRTSTYNYLWNKLQVVMLVKYVESENKAYWLLLSDVPEPNLKSKTFTVRIPKTNDLENIDWNGIHTYVMHISNEKLAKRQRFRFHKIITKQ